MKPLRPIDWLLMGVVLTLLALALALTCSPIKAHAADLPCGMTTPEVVATGVLGALEYADWRQTHELQGTTFAKPEVNPILGEHPSGTAIDQYFLGALVLSGVAACVLPDPYRTWFLGLAVGIEVGAVQRNWALGMKVGF